MQSFGLASAGVLLFPSLKLSAMGTAKTVKLSPILTHVRHGLFNTSQPPTDGEWIMDSLKALQRDRFFKNGYSAGNDDPLTVTIETNQGNNLQFFLQGDSVNCYLDSILLQPQTNHCYRADNLEIQVIYVDSGKTQTLNLRGKKSFFVALEGEPKVGTSTLKENLGLVLENKTTVAIKATQPAKLLLITEV